MSASSAGLCRHGTPVIACPNCFRENLHRYPCMAMPQIVESRIKKTKFRFTCEKDLQDGLERVFQTVPFIYEREVKLGNHGTIDFVLDRGTAMSLGIEVKTDGGLSLVTRQLHRYCESPLIEAVMLVTSKSQHDRMPEKMCGKNVYVVTLIGSAF